MNGLRFAPELGFNDHAEHRLPIDEQHDGIGVVLDRHEVVDRRLRESGLGKPRDLDLHQLEYVGDERRLIANQGEQTFMKLGNHGVNIVAIAVDAGQS